jgi:hypothetical protein
MIVFYLYRILKKPPAVLAGKKAWDVLYWIRLMLILLFFVIIIFITLLYFRPTIGGRTEEMLCGYGPDLSIILRKDAYLVRLRRNVFKLFNMNFEAAAVYLQRFEFIRQFIVQNEEKSHNSIKNEMGTDTFFKQAILVIV